VHESPLTAVVYEILRDGEWHDIYDVIMAVVPKVTPGHASRHSTLANRPELTDSEKIKMGRIRIARDCVAGILNRYFIETETPHPPRRLLTRGNTRIRIAMEYRGYVTAGAVSQWLGRHEHTVTSFFTRHPHVLEERGLRVRKMGKIWLVRPEDLPQWAEVLAQHRMLKDPDYSRLYYWAPYDRDTDALMDHQERRWLIVDGQPYLRKVKPRGPDGGWLNAWLADVPQGDEPGITSDT
jgi:hypothetical protein